MFREYIDNPLIVSEILGYDDGLSTHYRLVFNCLGREKDPERLADMNCFIYATLALDEIRRKFFKTKKRWPKKRNIKKHIFLNATTRSDDMNYDWFWTYKIVGDFRGGDYDVMLGIVISMSRDKLSYISSHITTPLSIYVRAKYITQKWSYPMKLFVDPIECAKIPDHIVGSVAHHFEDKDGHDMFRRLIEGRDRRVVIKHSIQCDVISKIYGPLTLDEKVQQAMNMPCNNLLRLEEYLFMYVIGLKEMSKKDFDTDIMQHLWRWSIKIAPFDHKTTWSNYVSSMIGPLVGRKGDSWGSRKDYSHR